MPSDTVVAVAKSFRDHRERFERFCRSLSDDELSRPVPGSTWTVKGFIAHLDTLDTEITRWFDAARAGRLDEAARDAKGKPFDIDRWNDERVAEREPWPVDQLLTEGARNREAMLAALMKLEDADIERVWHFAGDNKRPPADVPLKVFLPGLARHDPIHVADMVKALPERADDPELRSWLDDSVVRWYQTTMAGPPRR